MIWENEGMKYSLVAIGDSLTQGFRSLAVNREFQEDSFPFRIYECNKECFADFLMPNIESPGYPINLEYILYKLQEIEFIEDSAEKLAEEILTKFKVRLDNKNTNNNLGIVGFTAEEIFSASFNNSSTRLNKIILNLENKYFLSWVATLLNLIADGVNSIIYKHFIGLSFSRITCAVLGKKGATEIDCAKKIFSEDRALGRESLITYWAGANDIIGALLSGNKKCISDINKVLDFIEKTIEAILEEEGTTVVIGDIPDIRFVPFVNKETMRPIFPMYEEMSKETWNEIIVSVDSINLGIYDIFEKKKVKYKKRIELVQINSFFKQMCDFGQEVLLADGSKILLSSEYISVDSYGKLNKGGFFSLDGVHPGTTGYALVANEFIKAFNRLGKKLTLINIDDISANDKMLNEPPKYINDFLDLNSSVSNLVKKLGVYDFISTYILSQFNLNK